MIGGPFQQLQNRSNDDLYFIDDDSWLASAYGAETDDEERFGDVVRVLFEVDAY